MGHGGDWVSGMWWMLMRTRLINIWVVSVDVKDCFAVRISMWN